MCVVGLLSFIRGAEVVDIPSRPLKCEDLRGAVQRDVSENVLFNKD